MEVVTMQDDYVKQSARPLPVILLLDVSGSMDGNKIEALNASVREMLDSFAEEENTRAEIHTAILTFGGRVNLYQDLMPANEIQFQDMKANGGTPFGEALDLATDLINNKERLPSRGYRPTIVLVSDGYPTDDWKLKLDTFVNEGRTAKCDRWALGIGREIGEDMLLKFMNDPEKRVLRTEDASDIHKFFRFVTDSIKLRSISANPNKVTEDRKAFNPFEDDIDF